MTIDTFNVRVVARLRMVSSFPGRIFCERASPFVGNKSRNISPPATTKRDKINEAFEYIATAAEAATRKREERREERIMSRVK